jgi:heme A synthase
MRIEQSHRILTALIALAVSVRLAYAVWLALTVGADNLDNGDYILYVYGAQRILTYGDFNNSLFLPRPPLFPLIVAALGVNTTAVLLANALVGGLTVGFVYALGQRLGLPRWAVIGGCV